MLGGVALNGEQIYSQAQEELNKLEEQIQLAYELPPMHMIG
jgi:exonuclease VII small subunit